MVTAEVCSAKLFDPATPDGMVFVPGGIFAWRLRRRSRRGLCSANSTKIRATVPA
jgi:hypothetical protein